VILTSKLEGKGWTRPTAASFSAGSASDVDMFLTHDGRDLYFCSDRPDPKASAAGEGTAASAAPQSDIWVVSRTMGGWGEPRSLGAAVNSDRDDYYPTLTLDGTMYYSSNRAGSLGQNDIYRARRRDGGWTAPENLGAPVNTSGREYDPFIAPDESYLIFTSERPGGFGGADLYLSVRKPDGSWGEPRNLGPAINTAESEYTPMLSPDGKYLFFTRGRLGYDDLYWVEAEVLR
jgi:Tol biopolymer transport system component